MPIPKIDLPTYKLRLESLGKEITFRPFVVKEEKILMMALESQEYQTSLAAIKQILNNCILDEVDIESLPIFEIEYLFLNLRARSIGEKVTMEYICENVIEEDRRCKGQMRLDVDLLQVALEHKGVDSTIKLTKDVGIKLKYPTVEISKTLAQKFDKDDAPIEILRQCTDYVFDAQQVYKIEEMQSEEFKQFIDNLTGEQYNKIKTFFLNMPTLRYKSDLVCRKCGKNHTIRLEGLLDFFA